MGDKQASLAVPAERTWNICMLAHVDHGKSALSDCLISSNGIISDRLAGKVRYMDSREDEQIRGITMKSSSIALGHRDVESGELSVVHLVDSPGHVDFSGEVEAALRVCDGALLVVDVVEGVCVQTVTVLRAALEHAVTPVLVLNKLDRLFTELKLAPLDAYQHIWNVIEQVNVIMGVRQVEQMMESAALEDNVDEQSFEGEGDSRISGFFSPETGNVVFASAIHGWAFRISDFARIFSQRFGISENVLRKTLWGDYYLNMKSKKIIRKGRGEISSKSQPMFARLVLSSISSVYDAVIETQYDHDEAIKKRTNIAEKLGLKISARDLRHRDPEVVLHAMMGAWLPASRSLMEMITQKLPTSKQAQANPERLAVMWPHVGTGIAAHRKEAFERQHNALQSCAVGDSPTTPVIGVVTKMLDAPARKKQIQKVSMPKSREELAAAKAEESEKLETGDDDEEASGMMAFARLLSGTLKVGSELYVYGPKYRVAEDGSYDEATVSKAKVSTLHLLMGRGSENLVSANAGCIVGIGGLHDAVLKTATLSTEPPGTCLPAVVSARMQQDSVVRVAVEPHLPHFLPRLKEGLRKLNQSDPAVETIVTARGEYVIAASGDLHLERCLKDLRDKFAFGVKFHVSKPIVSFRETVYGGSSPYYDEKDGGTAGKDEEDAHERKPLTASDVVAEPFLAGGLHAFGKVVEVTSAEFPFRIRMVAAPIPTNLSNALEKAGKTVRGVIQKKITDYDAAEVREALLKALEEDTVKNVEQSELVKHWATDVFPRVWACGPNAFGSNLLIGPERSASSPDHVVEIFRGKEALEIHKEQRTRGGDDLELAVITGFQLGVSAGPLAEEPMHGVALFVDVVNENAGDGHVSGMTGAAIGSAKDCARKALLCGNARIMEGMQRVDISVPDKMLSKTYTVISKRRGQVLDEQIRDSVNVFGIEAKMPVVESFGFADKLRSLTSGEAVPQITFSHWEIVHIDPFWEPRTVEELEDLGAADNTAELNNLAKKLVNNVRRRKGLRIDEKIVEKAEKQRTLSRKK